MMHLNNILQTPWLQNRKAKSLLFLSIFLGFAGFLDATYLTIVHYKNLIPPCSAITNCELVLTSKYATFLGIPIALIGTLYYCILLAFLILLYQEKKKIFLDFSAFLVFSALGVSILLVYIQAGILHAFCQYCLLSEGINTALFLCIIPLLYNNKKNK